jgi:hypothetical protein
MLIEDVASSQASKEAGTSSSTAAQQQAGGGGHVGEHRLPCHSSSSSHSFSNSLAPAPPRRHRRTRQLVNFPGPFVVVRKIQKRPDSNHRRSRSKTGSTAREQVEEYTSIEHRASTCRVAPMARTPKSTRARALVRATLDNNDGE